jgi:hypothetical protein
VALGESARPGRLGAAALTALLAVAAGCTCRPEPADVLLAGRRPFRTPERAFETFKTAIGADLKDLGYRCLSKEFRRENGITQIALRELLRQEPWLRRISCSEIVESRLLDDRRAEVFGKVKALFSTLRFRVGFVREDYYELHAGERELAGGPVPELSRALRPRDGPRGTPGLELWVPLPPGTGAEDVTLILAGQEWKIDSFALLDEESEPLTEGATP